MLRSNEPKTKQNSEAGFKRNTWYYRAGLGFGNDIFNRNGCDDFILQSFWLQEFSGFRTSPGIGGMSKSLAARMLAGEALVSAPVEVSGASGAINVR